MKKSFVAILAVLLFTSVSIFAVDGVSFYTGVGYDLRSVSKLENSSHSMAVEAGALYSVGNGFSAYSDVILRFVGSGKTMGAEQKKGLFGYNLHAGILYGMRFIEKPEFEIYAGGGLSFANTSFNVSSVNVSFNNLGIGFKLLGAYRVNESLAITLSGHPDLYIFNNGNFVIGVANTATLGALFKF